MDEKKLLHDITELSHKFGGSGYVRGGGGNTSVKNDATLWVKPSGTTLATLQPGSFVAMSRKKLAELYLIEPPQDACARETLVKEKMAAAVLSPGAARASVEAPLHDSLKARFVVHTHPAAVNGMTCAKNGGQACRRLFPQALWLDYIDPGYTLCMEVRQAVEDYRLRYGRQPSIIFLKNHGVFVAGDSPEEIGERYAAIMGLLTGEYQKADIQTTLQIAAIPNYEKIEAYSLLIREAMGQREISSAAGGRFQPACGPVSPDHIVYSKSYSFFGRPDRPAISEFEKRYGYRPQVIVLDDAVFGVAASPKKAELALELAQDGALVAQLAEAFGGIDYMTAAARKFIENWEVESYRSRQL